jgi:hypothetical protein
MTTRQLSSHKFNLSVIQTSNHNFSLAVKMGGAIIPFNLLEIIMSFLATRELFNLVFLSPFLMQRLTTEMVVRAALFKGGRAKKSFEELYRLIVRRAIHPPSPLRLLRIACATKCEVCLNTVVYRFNNKVKFVRKGFAINSCWRCTTKRRKSKAFRKDSVEYTNNRRVYNSILDCTRTSAKQYGWREAVVGTWSYERARCDQLNLNRRRFTRFDRDTQTNRMILEIRDLLNYMWRTPLCDRTGEKIGPLVTYDDVGNMAQHLIEHMRENNIEESNDGAMADFVESYIVDIMRAPSEDDERYTDFEKAYESTIVDAEKHLKNVMWKRTTASVDWRIEKVHKCVEIVDKLRHQIKDNRVRSVLVYQLNAWFINGSAGCKKIPPIVFRDLWVREVMFDYLVAPSKVNLKVLKQLSLNLAEEYFKIQGK